MSHLENRAGRPTVLSRKYAVRIGEHTRPSPVPTGAPPVFSIRPEKIRLAAPGAAVPADACGIDGTIASVLYLGASTRFHVALAGGGELAVIEQNREESASTVSARQGQPVRLIWRRAHIQEMRQ